MLLNLVPDLFRKVLDFLVIKFTDHGADNRVYCNLAVICRSLQIDEYLDSFTFDFDLIRSISRIHALCLKEMNFFNPTKLKTHTTISKRHVHSYKNPASAYNERLQIGLCCWQRLTEMTNLRSLRLLSLETDDFSFFHQLTEADLVLSTFRYPLSLPPNLKKLRLSLMFIADAHMVDIVINCPTHLNDFSLLCEDLTKLGGLHFNEHLQSFTLFHANDFDSINCPSLQTLRFEDCQLYHIHTLTNLTALRCLQLPYFPPVDSDEDEDEEENDVGAYFHSIGQLPSLRELILPSIPDELFGIQSFSGLTKLTILDSCDEEDIGRLWELRSRLNKLNCIQCNGISLEPHLLDAPFNWDAIV
jgi:hypothetical protein